MKKQIIIILVGMLLAAGASGQSSLIKSKVKNLPNYDYAPYHFGFVLALNQMHFSIDPIDYLHQQEFTPGQAGDILPTPEELRVLGIDYQPEYGFTVGIVGNLRLAQYFDLRFIPSLAFGERVINYRIEKYNGGISEDTVMMEKRIPSTYIDFPLMVKYKSKRYNNMRAYVLGGVKYSLDLASLSDKREENTNNVLVKLERQDVSFEVGVGFDYYMSFFKFGMEIKMAYSPFDPLEREGNLYTGSIEELRSKYFQLSFTFE